MRSINNVVDVTNHVMLLTAQPLHAFDLDRLAGGAVVVRRAEEGERIVTLDGQERTLDPSVLTICDAERPAVIAGVFGAEFAEVGPSTTRVLLEAATFDGPAILNASLSLGLRTESSSRFEKGLPRELPPRAMAIACRLLVELCGARLVPGVLDAHVPAPERPPVRLRWARLPAVLGIEVPREEAAGILERLGCERAWWTTRASRRGCRSSAGATSPARSTSSRRSRGSTASTGSPRPCRAWWGGGGARRPRPSSTASPAWPPTSACRRP